MQAKWSRGRPSISRPRLAARFLLSRFPPAGSGSGADAESNGHSAQVAGQEEPDPAAAYPELYADVVKYVAYVLWRPQGRIPSAVLFGALYLLQTRAEVEPAPTEGPHALFLAAYKLASHMLTDEGYKIEAWRKIGSKIFSAEQIAQVERDFCRTMEWNLAIHAEPFEEFVRALAAELEVPMASAAGSISVQREVLQDFIRELSGEALPQAQ